MRLWLVLLIGVALLTAGTVRAQTVGADSLKRAAAADSLTKKNTVKKKEIVKDSARLALERLPGESVRRSLIVPGLGQIHNHRIWKVPIVYGGYVALGLVYDFNQRYYRRTLHEVQAQLLNGYQPVDPEFQGVDFQRLVAAKDYYRRNRDLTILGFLAWHSFQAVEAYVDAMMRRYDVSRELSFKIGPSVEFAPGTAAPGIKLAMAFK